jgi:catabolite regulation protein CreA
LVYEKDGGVSCWESIEKEEERKRWNNLARDSNEKQVACSNSASRDFTFETFLSVTIPEMTSSK